MSESFDLMYPLKLVIAIVALVASFAILNKMKADAFSQSGSQYQIEPLTAERFFFGDSLGNRYRISGAVSAYSLGTGMAWERTYAFRFNGNNLGGLRNLQGTGISGHASLRGLEITELSRSAISHCIDPRPDNNSETGLRLRFPVVCQVSSTNPGDPPATIGVVIPDQAEIDRGSGGQICASEALHWRTLPELPINEIIICVLVEQVPEIRRNDNAIWRPDAEWMDIIVFQMRDEGLVAIANSPRNGFPN